MNGLGRWWLRCSEFLVGLVLRYWLDLPLADVADTLDMALGTVKSTISRGQQALARLLEDSHE